MGEAILQSWEVLREAMGSADRLDSRAGDDLLHVVEAAAWLERLAKAGRHLFVPIAKTNGASWAELAAAMGVSRATAQHRHGQGVEEWEESIRMAAAPSPWEAVDPLPPVAPPEDFNPGDDDFVRMTNRPAWNYTGRLEAAIQYVRAHHTSVRVYRVDDVHYVCSHHAGGIVNTSADSEEDAWRAHLGLVLTGDGQPFPDDARPGETIAALKARLRKARR